MPTTVMYASNLGSGNKDGLTLATAAKWEVASNAKYQTQIDANPANDFELRVKGPISQTLVSFGPGSVPAGKKFQIKSIDASDVELPSLVFNGDRPNPWVSPASHGSGMINAYTSDVEWLCQLEFNNVGDGAYYIPNASRVNHKLSGGLKARNAREVFRVGSTVPTLNGVRIMGVDIVGHSKKAIRFEENGSSPPVGCNVVDFIIDGTANGMSGIIDSAGQLGDPSPVGVSLEAGNTGDASHNGIIRNLTIKNQIQNTGTNYPQGDGIGIEGGPYDILIENVLVMDSADGGFDLKGATVGGKMLTLKNCAAIGCMRSLRSHYSNVRIEGYFISMNLIQRYGSGDLRAHIWTDVGQHVNLAVGAIIIAVDDPSGTITLDQVKAYIADPAAAIAAAGDLSAQIAYAHKMGAAISEYPVDGVKIIRETPPAPLAITTLGSVYAGSTAATTVIPLTGAVPVGATVIAALSCNGNDALTSAVDSQGNVYTQVYVNNDGGIGSIRHYRCDAITTALGATGETLTITLAGGVSARFGLAWAFNYPVVEEGTGTSRSNTANTNPQNFGVSTALTAGTIIVGACKGMTTDAWTTSFPAEWTADEYGVRGSNHLRSAHRTVDNVTGANLISPVPAAAQKFCSWSRAYKKAP